jgi:hypothetical protein
MICIYLNRMKLVCVSVSEGSGKVKEVGDIMTGVETSFSLDSVCVSKGGEKECM